MNKTITQELLHSIYTYGSMTGELTYKVRTSARVWVGKQVGSLGKEGYWKTAIKGRSYQVHRLIWLYVHGERPNGQIDHINGVRGDNRLCNLREASQVENSRNRKVSSSNSSTDIKGIIYHTPLSGSPWYRASITISKGKRLYKTIRVSQRDTEQEVIEELERWLHASRKEHHKEFANDGELT